MHQSINWRLVSNAAAEHSCRQASSCPHRSPASRRSTKLHAVAVRERMVTEFPDEVAANQMVRDGHYESSLVVEQVGHICCDCSLDGLLFTAIVKGTKSSVSGYQNSFQTVFCRCRPANLTLSSLPSPQCWTHSCLRPALWMCASSAVAQQAWHWQLS